MHRILRAVRQAAVVERRRAVVAGRLIVAIVVGFGVAQGGVAAGARPTSIEPVHSCDKLNGRTFQIRAAAAHVTSATSVGAANGHSPYCDVRGTIDPAVGFELKLPDTYAGRYLQYGCSGFCGVVYDPALPSCGPSQVGGDFAVASTDDGHQSQLPGFGSFFDASFAVNQAARNDFNYRSPHVLAEASKQIIEGYYGASPQRSYFNGCSTGGREGLLLAQRYPHDFDGIIAGDPANIADPFYGVYLTWIVRANTDAGGAPILTVDKLQPLHSAVISACDGLDGLVDGQIDDPSACHFDPETLRCPPGTDQPSCLTPAQIDVVRKLYAGPTDTAGHHLYPGSEPYGSELAWGGAAVPINGQSVRPLPDNFLKYAAHPIGAPGSSVDTFPFTVDALNGLTQVGVDGNAMSLDLSAFRRAGGKLIIWHGWADQSIPPAGTLDYYQRLWEHNGGLRKTQQFARLFMVPAVYHCAQFAGGYTLNSFDPFPALVDWIEHSDAPDKIIAEQRDAQQNVVRSRPVFPYPLQTRYTGSDSVDEAANFVPELPEGPPHNVIRWAGDYLYHLAGPTAP